LHPEFLRQLMIGQAISHYRIIENLDTSVLEMLIRKAVAHNRARNSKTANL
jgi:hypothetical protein